MEGDELDLMTTLAGSSRRVRPQYVNYTKKAKRVDVRKLKENIWKSLDIKVPNSESPDESMVRFFSDSPFPALPCINEFIPLLLLIRTWTMKTRMEAQPIQLSIECSIRSFRTCERRTRRTRCKTSARASVSSACCIWLTSVD